MQRNGQAQERACIEIARRNGVDNGPSRESSLGENMFLQPFLTLIFLACHSAASIIAQNTSLLQLPTSNLTSPSFLPWPAVPYITTFGTTQLTIFSYGRPAAAPLLPEIQQDLDNLRRTLLRQPGPFSGASILLTSDIVTLRVVFVDILQARKLSGKNVGNVIASLSADMGKFGAREITEAAVGVEVHRSGVFNKVAEVRVMFRRVAESE